MDKAFEDEVEPTVSIQEYLKGVEEEELEADLVLGGDEGKECTYSQGYLKRQAIFSCLTCTPDGTAGVCTACSLSCHDGHEVVELWTKRNFRCDCGNSKFGEIFCKLFPGKDIENILNSYNHNFKGLYCTCGRPYPDPNAEEQEEMIQCCICEDWFHEDHIGLESSDEVPRDKEGEPLYDEFICQSCSASCSFLTLYPQTIWATGKKCDTSANNSKEKNVLGDTSSVDDSGKLESDNLSRETSEKNGDSSKCTEDVSLNGTCVIGVDLGATSESSDMKKPLFLSKSWRETLCRCEKCVEFYRKKNIGFLIDKEDSIAEYEKMATQKREAKLQQQEGADISLFNGLGHVEKIEILNGIADMKNEISAFFESSDPSKPITSADIHQVFENLAKKRRRVQ